MTKERDVTVEGRLYCVVISDEEGALLAAEAAGRAFVGVWTGKRAETGGEEGGVQAGESPDWLWKADYVVDCPEAADDRLLERVVRRKLGLPWIIAESERIRIREFAAGDVFYEQAPEEEPPQDAAGLWTEPDKRNAYIENQYGFYEYGIWAIVRRSDEKIVGAAGVSDCDVRRWQGDRAKMQLELGYHIFRPYRRQGYAEEACRLILDYVEQEYDCPVYAAVDAGNAASVRLLDKLGFRPDRGHGEPDRSRPDRSRPDRSAEMGSHAEPCHAKPCHAEPDAGWACGDKAHLTAQKCSGSGTLPLVYVRYWR